MAQRISPIGSTDSATAPSLRDDELQTFETNFMTTGIVQGVGGALAVTQRGAGANMSVDVASGLALTSFTNTNLTPSKTYKSWHYNDATVNVGISTADATNPRKDIIVAKIDGSTNPNSSASNIASIYVIAGTPAGSPTAPSVPSGAQLLATIAVAAGATSIVTANITDGRSYVQLNPDILQDVIRQGLVKNVAVAGGTGDALTLTYSPAITAYTTNMVLFFQATAANTTTATVNVNGLGAKTLKKWKNGSLTNLEVSDLAVGAYHMAVYDGTYFQISTPVASTSAQIKDIGFYGDASDGSTNWTSGVSLDPNNSYNYTTSTLPVSQTLTVSSVNKVLRIKNTGDVTINGTVDLDGKGAAGGTGGAQSGAGGSSTAGASIISGFTNGAAGGGSTTGNGGAGGGGGASAIQSGTAGSQPGAGGATVGTAGTKIDSSYLAFLGGILRGVVCGSGGGGGGGGSSAGATGGAGSPGGGALVWYIAGNLTLGAASIIQCRGSAGITGVVGSWSIGGGGGGGGGGGTIVIVVAGTVTDNGVTLRASGGAAGPGVGAAGAAHGGDGGPGADGRIVIISLKTGTVITA